MGMITRVRGRLRSLHNIHKLDPEIRDEKIAQTGEIYQKKLFQNFQNYQFFSLLAVGNVSVTLLLKRARSSSVESWGMVRGHLLVFGTSVAHFCQL